MKIKEISTCVILFFTAILFSQEDNLLLIDNIPQRININPAFQPINNWYVSIPLLGNNTFNIQNSGFSWQNLVDNNIANNIKKSNIARIDNTFQMIGGGFMVKDMYFSFQMNHKWKASLIYPNTFMGFRDGNWDYDSNIPIPYITSGIQGFGAEYNEFAIGFSKSLSERSNIGFRIKYLVGTANFNIDNLDVRVITEQNGDINISSEASLQTSVPEDVEFANQGAFSYLKYDSKMLYFANNHGFAIDGGITSRFDVLDKNLMLGFSFQDLGFIKWKNEAAKYTINDSYIIDGADITNEIIGNSSSTIIDYWNAIIDSVDNNFSSDKAQQDYTTLLHGNFNFCVIYDYNDWLRVGASMKNYITNGMLVPTLGLSLGTTYKEKYSVTFCYSATKNSFGNIGLGTAAKFGPIQLFANSGNIISLAIPHKTKSLSFNFGINFIPEGNQSDKNSLQKTGVRNSHTNYRFKKTKKNVNSIRRTTHKVSSSTNPSVSKIVNISTNEENSTFTSKNVLQITGRNLRIEGNDKSVGVWFINVKDGSKVKATKIITNSEKELLILAPEVDSGEYLIEISTQFNGKGRNSKEVKTFIYKGTLKTVE